MVWTPWGQGIGSAIFIHSLAAIPWMVLLAGHSLLRVEPELEEEALSYLSQLKTACHVTLKRSWPMIFLATIWIGLQIATEITVTDLMQIRTIAEEVYTQLVAPDNSRGSISGESRALAVAIPVSLVVGVLLALIWIINGKQIGRRLADQGQQPVEFELKSFKWICFGLVFLFCIFEIGLPLFSLGWRAGARIPQREWSAPLMFSHLLKTTFGETRLLGNSLLAALFSGMITTALATVACWCARESMVTRIILVVLSVIALVLPGPVTGLGLKSGLQIIVDGTGSEIVADWLWHGPSIIPIIWVDLIRFFPVGVALVWPMMERMPADLFESSRIEGARPDQELLMVVVPFLKTTLLRTTLVVAILSLAELSASKLVSTPPNPSLAGELFAQMHYGVNNNLAARCIVLIGMVISMGIGVSYLSGKDKNR